MREIKFKCWTGKSMSPPLTLELLIDNTAFDEGVTYLQFTGHSLGDKEIYEADVIREESDEDSGTDFEYYVCVWIKEWSMFAWLHLHDEYDEYLQNGVDGLDEASFWTFPIESEKENAKRFLCGNIYSNPELLKYELYKKLDDE